jgi:hypothetical protein
LHILDEDRHALNFGIVFLGSSIEALPKRSVRLYNSHQRESLKIQVKVEMQGNEHREEIELSPEGEKDLEIMMPAGAIQ